MFDQKNITCQNGGHVTRTLGDSANLGCIHLSVLACLILWSTRSFHDHRHYQLLNVCSLELKESETPRIQLPVLLTPDYWIVCKHALNQQQCGDICILRAHISFLAKMIEFPVLKYSVLWIPHPVRAEKFYFQCHFSLNFSPRNSISNKTIWKGTKLCIFTLCKSPFEIEHLRMWNKNPSQTYLNFRQIFGITLSLSLL